eukprot:scaffold22879_cov92-Isochrysis_galbana.AAC.2
MECIAAQAVAGKPAPPSPDESPHPPPAAPRAMEGDAEATAPSSPPRYAGAQLRGIGPKREACIGDPSPPSPAPPTSPAKEKGPPPPAGPQPAGRPIARSIRTRHVPGRVRRRARRVPGRVQRRAGRVHCHPSAPARWRPPARRKRDPRCQRSCCSEHLPKGLPVKTLPVNTLPVKTLPVKTLRVKTLRVKTLPVKPQPVKTPV